MMAMMVIINSDDFSGSDDGEDRNSVSFRS